MMFLGVFDVPLAIYDKEERWEETCVKREYGSTEAYSNMWHKFQEAPKDQGRRNNPRPPSLIVILGKR